MGPRVILLDTSSLMYRAYYALPATIRDGAQRPVNAVFGYLDMTTRLLEARKPDRLVHVFDDAVAPEERVRAFPAYKAQRRPDPEGLPWQFPLVEDVLAAAGAERVRAPGWEADDAIGTLCARAEPDACVEIVTGDRDLLQLVRDGDPVVRLLFTVRGVSEMITFDVAAVLGRYGVPPDRYVDFATLRGDPSDGLPGVPGIGEKTAGALVSAFASIEAMLEPGTGMPRGVQAKLRAATDYLAAMRDVVPVRKDVTLHRACDPADPARLAEIGARHNLMGPLRRMAAVLGIEFPSAGAGS